MDEHGAVDRDEAQRSIDALVGQALRYRASDEFVRLLRFTGRFRRYSPFNALLVHVQRPGSAYVATAGQWQGYDRLRLDEEAAMPPHLEQYVGRHGEVPKGISLDAIMTSAGRLVDLTREWLPPRRDRAAEERARRERRPDALPDPVNDDPALL